MSEITGSSWSSLSMVEEIRVWTGKRKTRYMLPPLIGGRGAYAVDIDADSVRVDRKTLRVHWRVPTDGYSPLFEHDDLLLIADFRNAKVGARHISTGEVAWTAPFNCGPLSLWRGSVLAVPSPDTAGNVLLVLDPGTGQVRDTIENFGKWDAVGPLFGDILLCSNSPVYRAFDLRERRVLWEHDFADLIASRYGAKDAGRPLIDMPSSTSGFRLLRWHASLVGFSIADGNLRWHAMLPYPDYGHVSHRGRFCALVFDRLIGIDEESGATVFDERHPRIGRVTFISPATAYEDKIVYPTTEGHVAVFNIQDGSFVSCDMYKAGLWGAAEADGRLFITTATGKLLVYADK